jgi:hypothetical protein
MADAAERLLVGGLGRLGQDLGSLHTAAASGGEDVARAAAHLEAARRALEGPVGALLPPVSNAARDVLTELDETAQRLSTVGDSLRLTSHLTEPGVDVRLLLISQDPLELRPTGGLIGSFGVIHIADGAIRLEEFSDVGVLPSPEPPMAAPPELAEHLTQPWNIVNSNWWPDFPTSARTAAEMFARHGKGKVDGVIAITDATVARLVGALGPIQLSDFDEPVVQDGFAERVLHEVVLKRPLDEPRKKFLTDLAHELFRRLLNVPEDKAAAVVAALGEAAAVGDLQLWFENPQWQRLLDPGLTGSLPAAGGDHLQLAEANMTAGKANIGVVRNVDYMVNRDESGRLRAHLQIRYRNDAPESDINPYYHGLVRVYVPRGSQLLDGPGSIFDAPDGPYSVLMARFVVQPDGGTAVVAFDYLLPDDVAPDGHYRLTVIRQPGTGRDTYAVFVANRRFDLRSGDRRLTVAVDVPGGREGRS